MSILGDRIKELRKNKELTQEQLGKKLNVAKSTISQYETGTNVPDISILIKIADIFDCSLDFLTGRTDDSDSIVVTNKELNKYLDDDLKKKNIKIEIDRNSELNDESLKQIAAFFYEKYKNYLNNKDKK